MEGGMPEAGGMTITEQDLAEARCERCGGRGYYDDSEEPLEAYCDCWSAVRVAAHDNNVDAVKRIYDMRVAERERMRAEVVYLLDERAALWRRRDQLFAEVERMRQLLKQHGIDDVG